MSRFTIDVNEIINTEIVLKEGLANVRKKYLETGIVDGGVFHELLQADPTPQKKYSDWAFKHIYLDFKNANGKVDNSDPSIFDTIQELNTAFIAFEHGLSKGFVVKKDINQYKSIKELIEVVNAIQNKQSKNQEKKSNRYNETVKVFENDTYLIVNPQSWDACKLWAKGAKWCIAYEKDRGYWDLYTHEKQLKFYFVLNKTADSRHLPLSKIALGVDESDDIVEAFDATDSEIVLEDFLDTLNTAGIPTEKLFVHDGWEEMATIDRENEIAEISKKLDAEIEGSSLEHITIYYDADVYHDSHITPEEAFTFGATFEIEIPANIEIRKNLNDMSDSTINSIIAEIDDYTGSVDTESTIDEDNRTIRIHLINDGSYSSDMEMYINSFEELDDEYDSILKIALIGLASDGIIIDDTYKGYINTLELIDDHNYDVDAGPFMGFKNISVITYDDELSCTIEFNNINITATSDIRRLMLVDYNNSIQYDTAANDYLLCKIIVSILDVVNDGLPEYYAPAQALLPGILPEPTMQFSKKDITTIRTLLEDSTAGVKFEEQSDVIFKMGNIKFTPPIGSDIVLLFDALKIVDGNYDKFNIKLVQNFNAEINAAVNSKVFNTDISPVKENFNTIVSNISKWRLA